MRMVLVAKCFVLMVFYAVTASAVGADNPTSDQPRRVNNPTYIEERYKKTGESFRWTQNEPVECTGYQRFMNWDGRFFLRPVRIIKWVPKTYYNIHWCKKRRMWVCDGEGCEYYWDEEKRRVFRLPAARGRQYSRENGQAYIPHSAKLPKELQDPEDPDGLRRMSRYWKSRGIYGTK